MQSAVLMDQAKEVLESIRQKYKIGLITNGRTEIQYGKLDQLGIRNMFDVIIVSEEAGVKKPSPEIFHMALDHLALEAEACIFIGDHPVNDIEGAARVGMAMIWIKVNQPWNDEVEVQPLAAIHQLKEGLEVID